MKKLHITLPPEMIEQINELRGDVPFSAWIRRAISQRIQIAEGIATLIARDDNLEEP